MKKLLLFLLGAPILALVGLIGFKFYQNPSMKVPFPYEFSPEVYNDISVDAPIVIIGDRMGVKLSNFSKLLADTISEDLSNPIKVESIAQKGEGIHRTLEKVKKLKKLPLFLIYIGGGEETFEKKFNTSDIPVILKNFNFYNDDLIQTLLIIYPDLSRLIYEKFERQSLSSQIQKDESNYSAIEHLKRNEIEFSLYQYHLRELLSYAKEHNSAVITISHPINLDIAPKESCPGTINEEGIKELEKVMELVKQKDYKTSYNITSELSKKFQSNARVHYLNGMIAKNLGNIKHARKSLIKSSAFDCKPWRATAVYNGILKKVSRENQIFYYDFNRYLEDKWTQNLTFEDEIYPQNYYIEKMVKTLAGKIRKVLKL